MVILTLLLHRVLHLTHAFHHPLEAIERTGNRQDHIEDNGSLNGCPRLLKGMEKPAVFQEKTEYQNRKDIGSEKAVIPEVEFRLEFHILAFKFRTIKNRTAKGEFIGIFNLSSNGDASSNLADAHARGLEPAEDIEIGGVAFHG